MGKKVLITGASGGFGKLTAETLLQNGHEVVGTMRNVNGRNKEVAAELESKGAKIVEMDVTSNESVEAGIAKAIEVAGGLDIVVNNAGIGCMGMQEHFTAEDWQKIFDVNVFGVQRVNRAALPHLRNQKDGVLIHVSSLLGRMTLPFYGAYNASKWALEALAENYRAELSGFGIESCLVEPGGYPTTFFNHLVLPSDSTRNEAYGEFINAPQQMAQSFGEALAQNPAQNPQDVADAIAGLVDTDKGMRPMRVVVDKMGMGDFVKKQNEKQEEMTQGIYGNFGIGGMLNVN